MVPQPLKYTVWPFLLQALQLLFWAKNFLTLYPCISFRSHAATFVTQPRLRELVQRRCWLEWNFGRRKRIRRVSFSCVPRTHVAQHFCWTLCAANQLRRPTGWRQNWDMSTSTIRYRKVFWQSTSVYLVFLALIRPISADSTNWRSSVIYWLRFIWESAFFCASCKGPQGCKFPWRAWCPWYYCWCGLWGSLHNRFRKR